MTDEAQQAQPDNSAEQDPPAFDPDSIPEDAAQARQYFLDQGIPPEDIPESAFAHEYGIDAQMGDDADAKADPTTEKAGVADPTPEGEQTDTPAADAAATEGAAPGDQPDPQPTEEPTPGEPAPEPAPEPTPDQGAQSAQPADETVQSLQLELAELRGQVRTLTQSAQPQEQPTTEPAEPAAPPVDWEALEDSLGAEAVAAMKPLVQKVEKLEGELADAKATEQAQTESFQQAEVARIQVAIEKNPAWKQALDDAQGGGDDNWRFHQYSRLEGQLCQDAQWAGRTREERMEEVVRRVGPPASLATTTQAAPATQTEPSVTDPTVQDARAQKAIEDAAQKPPTSMSAIQAGTTPVPDKSIDQMTQEEQDNFFHTATPAQINEALANLAH